MQRMHPRAIYKLDTVTGDETIAFNFTGDYAALSIGFSFNDLIVYNNKIFTSELTGKVFSQDAAGNAQSETLSLKNGLVIIDMITADITYITADYVKNAVGDTELSLKHDSIHMKNH